MRSLIRIFAGRLCPKVHFLALNCLWLAYLQNILRTSTSIPENSLLPLLSRWTFCALKWLKHRKDRSCNCWPGHSDPQTGNSNSQPEIRKGESVNQSINVINQSQSINQSNSRSVDRVVARSINQLINQPILSTLKLLNILPEGADPATREVSTLLFTSLVISSIHFYLYHSLG